MLIFSFSKRDTRLELKVLKYINDMHFLNVRGLLIVSYGSKQIESSYRNGIPQNEPGQRVRPMIGLAYIGNLRLPCIYIYILLYNVCVYFTAMLDHCCSLKIRARPAGFPLFSIMEQRKEPSKFHNFRPLWGECLAFCAAARNALAAWEAQYCRALQMRYGYWASPRKSGLGSHSKRWSRTDSLCSSSWRDAAPLAALRWPMRCWSRPIWCRRLCSHVPA